MEPEPCSIRCADVPQTPCMDTEMRRARLPRHRPHRVCHGRGVSTRARTCPAAQDVTESALKAAYIYNFAKFTEWPAGVVAAAEPLALCVFGDADVGDALKRAVKDRVLGGHPMAVSDIARARHRRSATSSVPRHVCVWRDRRSGG